jgi:hypothetical protein
MRRNLVVQKAWLFPQLPECGARSCYQTPHIEFCNVHGHYTRRTIIPRTTSKLGGCNS